MMAKGLDKVFATASGKPLSEVKILDVGIWYTAKRDANGKIYATEPKFSNNAGTLANRPDPDVGIQHLTMAGAWTNHPNMVDNMEGATLSGKIAARRVHALLGGNEKDMPSLVIRPRRFDSVLGPVRALDRVLYKLSPQLPSSARIFELLLVLLLVAMLVAFKKLVIDRIL